MEKFSVVIIGGGPAGLTCGITLASAEGKFDFVEGNEYLVIYDEYSDLDKALLNNVPAVQKGTKGKELLERIRKQAEEFPSLKLKKGKVVKAEGEKGSFWIKLEDGSEFTAEYLVIATGFHKFDIEGLDVQVVPHRKSPRQGKIMIKNENGKVREGLFVAGLVAGVPTMYACASGSGAEVACDILSEWAGKTVVVHDVPDSD
ncbi:FAD-dependent oxidoreductase [Persephonella sp.]